MYEDNCYNACPPKTKAAEGNFLCEFFNCTNYYNYAQDGCEDGIPDGYFVNDTEWNTIDKCHENCSTCRGRGVEGDTNCTKCKDGLHLHRRNCYDYCKNGYLSTNPRKCKCFEEKCKECSDPSLEYDLCISCNEGYFQKSDEPLIHTFMECYKNPEKYYLDNNQYQPCFNSCLNCTGSGDYFNQHCMSCDAIYSFAIEKGFDKGFQVYNCYPNCSFYYYFDNNIYKCSEENKCPKEFGKLLNGSRECVKTCADYAERKKEYQKKCYKVCPVDEELLVDKTSDICRAKCPNFEEPFEMIEEQTCVSNCTIMERKEGKCITNYYGPRSNAEVQDKVLSNIMDDIIDTFNYTYIDEYNSIVLEEKDHIYEIISSNSKVNNPKTSSLYLKNCEKSLKSYYGIPDNDPLIILKLDAYREGQTGPTVEYQIYYSFNKRALEQLDLTLCEGDGVSILISYNMTEGEEDQYNKNSGYYNDICYTYTSGNGTDMILTDRQDEFANNNKSLCEAGCDFVQYHKDLGQAECSCEAKTNLNLVSDIQVDKSKLYNFIDIKKIANFDVMKCYNLVTSFDGLKGNIGFYCFLPVFLMLLISCIIFYCKEFKTIKRQINEIVYAKMNYQYMSIVKPKPKPKEVKPKYEEPIFLQFLKKKKKNSAYERRG